MSVRLRRLQAEHERLTRLFAGHERIRIVETAGDPPEEYVIEYRLRGLVEERDGIRERDTHRVRITLGPYYPKERPHCEMLTPVFHPNIDHLAICTEDIRDVGQTLDQTVVFIGRMIAFQDYNLQSPRNGEAARWAAEHTDRFPLDTVDLTPWERIAETPHVEPRPPVAPAELSCSNCGATSPGVAVEPCARGHLVCPDCVLPCAGCGQRYCLLCELGTCTGCGARICAECATRQHGEQCRLGARHIVITNEEVRSVPESAVLPTESQVTLTSSRAERISGKALASFVFGLVGLPVLGILLGWFAILFGAMALRERDEPLTNRGKRLAVAGLLLGVLDVVAWAILFAALGTGRFLPDRLTRS